MECATLSSCSGYRFRDPAPRCRKSRVSAVPGRGLDPKLGIGRRRGGAVQSTGGCAGKGNPRVARPPSSASLVFLRRNPWHSRKRGRRLQLSTQMLSFSRLGGGPVLGELRDWRYAS